MITRDGNVHTFENTLRSCRTPVTKDVIKMVIDVKK